MHEAGGPKAQCNIVWAVLMAADAAGMMQLLKQCTYSCIDVGTGGTTRPLSYCMPLQQRVLLSPLRCFGARACAAEPGTVPPSVTWTSVSDFK
jgi:hypothetical protein